MDVQQTSPNFSSNGAIQKTQVNGLDSGTSVGCRHHLPQIAVMARNPKIAQSKTSAKTEMANLEKATVHVEGVGKVLRISEEGMEVEDSPAKTKSNGEDTKDSTEKLLESVEMMDSVSGLGKEETDPVSDKGDANTLTEDESAPTTKPVIEQKTLNEQQNNVVSETNNSPDRASNHSRSRRKSSLLKTETTEKSPAKGDTTMESTSTELSSDDTSSPVGKRHRKPKKLDLETEEDTPKGKAPKEKPIKTKVEVTPEVEAKYPGMYGFTRITEIPEYYRNTGLPVKDA